MARESEELQRLQAQRQKVQDALEELDQQKSSLEEQLTHIRQQTNQETQLVSLLELTFYGRFTNFFTGRRLANTSVVYKLRIPPLLRDTSLKSGSVLHRSHHCSRSMRSRNRRFVSTRRSWSRPERSSSLCRRRAGGCRRRSRPLRSSLHLCRSLSATLLHKLHRWVR